MAEEVLTPWLVAAVALVFLAGVLGPLVYYRFKPVAEETVRKDAPGGAERLEYYERQLIDLKIRLDAMEMGMMTPAEEKDGDAPPDRPEHGAEGAVKGDAPGQKERPAKGSKPPTPAPALLPRAADVTNHVLRLITDKPMTSRDIQITVGRTREHTSRLMKHLYESGLAERRTNSRPYAYFITDEGRRRLGLPEGGAGGASA